MQGHTRTLDPSHPGDSLEFPNLTAHPGLDNFDNILRGTPRHDWGQLIAAIVLAWCQPEHPRGLRVTGNNLTPHWRRALAKLFPGTFGRGSFPIVFEVGRPNATCVQTVKLLAPTTPHNLADEPLLTLTIGAQAFVNLLPQIGNKGLARLEFDKNAIWVHPVLIRRVRQSVHGADATKEGRTC